MRPAQRREVLQQRIVHGRCMPTQCVEGPLQIHGVPQHNGRRDEVQAAGAVALLLKAAVPDFSQPVGEHRSGQRWHKVMKNLDWALCERTSLGHLIVPNF